MPLRFTAVLGSVLASWQILDKPLGMIERN